MIFTFVLAISFTQPWIRTVQPTRTNYPQYVVHRDVIHIRPETITQFCHENSIVNRNKNTDTFSNIIKSCK